MGGLSNVSSSSLIIDKPIRTPEGNSMYIDEPLLTFEPFEKKTVALSLRTVQPERVE
jgi:hypothetical protein